MKILDFGLAKLSSTAPGDVAQPTISEAGMVMGTANYMSPEQATGARLDVRSDIFSFGCVVYEMLTGARPFARASTPETMTAILKDDPPIIVAVEVPAELHDMWAGELNGDSAYGVRFERPSTLATGADRCRFDFYRSP